LRSSRTIRWLFACLLLPWLSAAPAQTLESVLRPGDLWHGHAKWEEDCSKCHVRFDRAAQDRLCADCHKDVGQDVRERTGFHGRSKPQACRSCHTDHKGRNARIVEFDRARFDHAMTDYALRGRHARVECDKCHQPGRKFREAASDCSACHRKDDVHKGSLGVQCADCHTENDWKEKARFDHDKTRFPLQHKHAAAQCADCHKKGADYKEAPRACIGCHKRDDEGPKGHRGQYGERCDSCHGSKGWKPALFNHDNDTRFRLRGKHNAVRCASCHTGPLYKQELGTACIDCHKKDDDGPKGHRGSLGRDCASCHVETGWKERGKFDHDRSAFPLLGRHSGVKCADCHTGGSFKQAPKDCIACHKKDDRHEASLGTQCHSCHDERAWKPAPRFDHDKTRFVLRHAHARATVACRQCHADAKHMRDTPVACASCHQKDDKHQGQLGAQCDSCHGERDWKVPRFDHARTRFALLGKHSIARCDACHTSARYRDAPRECVACHQRDDKHRRAFGTACESCHNARAWGIWNFDHARRTGYALDGGHRTVACARCHTAPAPTGRQAAEVGTACVGCHRRDDTHDGSFGSTCEKCHVTERWRQVRTRVGHADRALRAAQVLGEASLLSQWREDNPNEVPR